MQRATLAVARTFVFFEDHERLSPEQATWRISLSSAPPFRSFDDARAHLERPPLAPGTDVVWNDGWFDVYMLYPIDDALSAIDLAPQLHGLGHVVKLHVHFAPLEGRAVWREVAPDEAITTLGSG